MPFEGWLTWPRELYIRWAGTLAPTREYDRSIWTAVAMRPVAAITLGICCCTAAVLCVLALLPVTVRSLTLTVLHCRLRNVVVRAFRRQCEHGLGCTSVVGNTCWKAIQVGLTRTWPRRETRSASKKFARISIASFHHMSCLCLAMATGESEFLLFCLLICMLLKPNFNLIYSTIFGLYYFCVLLCKKNWVVGCWRGYLSGARCRLAYGPADMTATHCLLLQ